MKHDIRLKVNGEFREIQVDSSRTLSDVLMDDLRMSKTKEGCGVGECGSCTVSVDRKLINSCLLLAVDVDGSEIVTMEELSTQPGFTSVMEAFNHPDQGVWRARATLTEDP